MYAEELIMPVRLTQKDIANLRGAKAHRDALSVVRSVDTCSFIEDVILHYYPCQRSLDIVFFAGGTLHIPRQRVESQGCVRIPQVRIRPCV